jgi:hypothetical protein
LTFFVDETELAYASISNYMWALRTWMKFQRQIDPAYGIVEWHDVMAAVEVITFVAAEPRKEVPGSWIVGACTHADKTSFKEVQNVLVQLILLNTFSRSESPLAKSYTGAGEFDPMKNLQVQDVKVEMVAGKKCVGVRLKAIKQDARMERPEARGDGDWVWIADTEGPCGIIQWLMLFFSFFEDGRRPAVSPFFVTCDPARKGKGYLYSHALADARELWARTPGVTVELAKTCGLHGLRVAGHNGTTRTLGKAISKVQGGWSSDQSQTRYDRTDLADIVRIPGAIVSSWASREVDFDFAAIQPPEVDRPRQAPEQRPSSAPTERVVEPPTVRNVRVTQPYAAVNRQPSCLRLSHVGTGQPVAEQPSASSSFSVDDLSTASSSASQPSQSPSSRRVRRAQGVSATQEAQAQIAPALPPRHAEAQRRVEESPHLSLTRPVRNARLAVQDRLPVGVSGTWRSST